ncbi:MAG: EBNA-1 protein [Chloroflexi bacterium CSP1-4]|nr:MAG: EBNA-1 protein [Chloroflexi bacterium CSP1-4]
MITESPSPRSRRALLNAALGAGVATIAAALGRPLPAKAADGDPVVVGGTYTASSVTRFDTGATGAIALWGYSTSQAGVYGQSTSGNGVIGESSSGTGVAGNTTSGIGVVGFSPSGIGVYGISQTNTGVQGFSGAFGAQPGGAAPAKTGVHGYAAQDANARGVHGQTTAGRGVYGQATSGYGVRGYATSGTAGYFATARATTGFALHAVGRVRLDKSAGLATIISGAKSVVVTPGINLVPVSAVVATLQGDAGGTTTVHRVAVNATTNTFTIYLTANSTAHVQVAWIVLG